MTLYKRVEDGVTIEWSKTDELAEQAVEEITESTDYPVEVDKETAREIRERYRELKKQQEASEE